MEQDDKRKLPRRIADEVMRIYDANTNQLVGLVVNITTDGFMLTGDHPIEPNSIFQLHMILAESRFDKNRISFGAESLWCSQTNEANRYWTGFQIIDISIPAVDFIKNLIDDWTIEEQ